MADSVGIDQEAWRRIVTGAMQELDVVGASVAVVHKDAVVFCEGFGRRGADAEAPVDADTLFAIGSSTKAFTTMSIAILAEDGKVDWDAPVRRYMPDFALKDPFATNEVAARDMACHRVGLPRHELSWYKSGHSRKDLVERLRHLEPSRPFRTAFQYQNMMFATLGYLVERVSGKTWEDFAAERILAPLGMDRTNFSVHTSTADPNHALPYAGTAHDRKEKPFADIDAIGPAGSINSCARDMAQWLRLHLGDGTVDARRLVSRGGIAMMHAPHIVLPRGADIDERRQAPAYGLGWFTDVYMGRTVVHHGGNIDGFTAMVLLVPEAELGVVVLCNQEISVLPTAVAFGIVDQALALAPRDWPAYLRSRMEKLLALAHQGGDFTAERVEGTAPSHALDSYAGEYEHPAYGTLGIVRTPQGLSLSYHPWPAPIALEHFHYDVFVLRAEIETIPLALRLPFRLGLDGAVESLEIRFEETTAPIVFRRTPKVASLSSEDLGRYVGRYLLAGVQKVQVELSAAGRLTTTVAGSAPLALVAQGEHRFEVKDLPGSAVQFHVTPDGRCSGGKVTLPSGIFPLTLDTDSEPDAAR